MLGVCVLALVSAVASELLLSDPDVSALTLELPVSASAAVESVQVFEGVSGAGACVPPFCLNARIAAAKA